MKTVDRLPELTARLGLADDPAAQKQLGEFLHQVVHDLNNPMGTFGLEFYSLGYQVQQLRSAASARDTEQLEQATAALAEIQENLQSAHQNAAAILEAMEQYSASLANKEDRGG